MWDWRVVKDLTEPDIFVIMTGLKPAIWTGLYPFCLRSSASRAYLINFYVQTLIYGKTPHMWYFNAKTQVGAATKT